DLYATKSRRYLAVCKQALTADEQQTFFNKFTNHLSDALGKRASSGGGGGLVGLPNGNALIYCRHADFGTRESSETQTTGGVRGTLTMLMVSDGQSSTLFVALTEASPKTP
ncbi:MAG: hypothetical protein K2V38_02325, partial [Gemmataceae bacterium]|nr:hypothetical protein [Gemmataceae bacterium]